MTNEQKQLELFDYHPENNQDFFIKKRLWSAAKHRILLKYIQAHCYSLGGGKKYQSEYINYVDGFAGIGKYDEGIGIEDFINNSNFWKKYKSDFLDTDGSPLIALKCARIFKSEGRVILRCFFTEHDKNNNQLLLNNCNAIGKGLDFKIYDPEKFSLVLPKIMPELKGYPTIFFLDAFGVKGVNFQQLCSIAEYLSRNKGELFLLFHNRTVARSAGFYKTSYKDEREEKTAATYMQHLTNLLGTDSDKDWKPKWEELQKYEQEFEKWALRYFKNRLVNESSFKGVASFEIKESYNDSRPQYSIVVGTNHPGKAFGELLNEFIFDENKTLFYHVDKMGKNQIFLDQQWQRQEKGKIFATKQIIINNLHKNNQKWMIVDDVITSIILELDELGYLKRSHYRQILIELYKEKVVEAKELGKTGNLTLKSYIKVVQ